MSEQKDYLKEISEIRSMMERSTKFFSLSGWSGIIMGIYALIASYIAKELFNFDPTKTANLFQVAVLAVVVLIAALGTAIYLSFNKASGRKEPIWNPTAKRLLFSMAVPLVTGGLLILIFISKGMIAFVIPSTLLFYGLSLYAASKFTYEEVRSLGLIEIVLGLISAYFVDYGLLCWAIGFGIFHIVYGIYLHYKYER